MRTSSQAASLAVLLAVSCVCTAQAPTPPPVPMIDAPDWISYPSVLNTGKFTVAWDASQSQDACYLLFMDTKEDFSTAQQVYDGNGLSWLCEACADGSYYFQVQAYVPGLYSSWYTKGDHAMCIDSSLPDPPAEPAAPAGLTAPAEAGSDFVVSWTRLQVPALYELRQEYMFRVPMGYPMPGWGYQPTISTIYEGSNNSVLVSPVDSDDLRFRFQVRSHVMFHGHPVYGPWSDWTGHVFIINALPGPPFQFWAQGSSSGGTVTLSVTAGNGALSYEFEEDYDLEFGNPVQVYPVMSGPQPAGGGSFVLSGKTDGMYFYRVRSVNSLGKSSWRDCPCGALVTGCPASNPPSTPDSLVVAPGKMYNWIRITWSGVAEATSYEVQEDTSEIFDSPVNIAPYAGQLYCTLYDRPDGTYYYRVRAVNTLGQSEWRLGSNPCAVVSFSATAVVTRKSGSAAFADILPDSEGVVAMVLDVRADAERSVEIRGITLSASGSGDDCMDVAMLRLYRDADGDGKWSAGADDLLRGSGGFDADNGFAAFSNINRVLPAGSAETWFVVADFAGSAGPLEDFTFSLPYDYTACATVVDCATGLPIPVAGAPASGARITVYGSSTPGYISVCASPSSPEDEQVAAGTEKVVMAAFSISADGRESVNLYSIAINALGGGDDAAHVSAATLAVDVDGDGSWTEGVDRIIDVPRAFDADNGIVTFDARGEAIEANGSMGLLVLYDFKSSAPEGAAFVAELSEGSVQATGAVSVETAPAGGLPISGRTVTIAPKTWGVGGNPGCSAACAMAAPDSAGALLPFLALAASIAIARVARRRTGSRG